MCFVWRCPYDVVPADGSRSPADGWGRFVSAVAYELAQAGRPAIGLTGHLVSDVPEGAGLSSSAALEVVLALALCAAAEIELAPLELAALCRRAEHRAVGVPSGIMDQAVAVLGRQGQAVMLDCTRLEHRYAPVPGDTCCYCSTPVCRADSRLPATDSAPVAAALPVLWERRPAEVARTNSSAISRRSTRSRPGGCGTSLQRTPASSQPRRPCATATSTPLARLFAASHASLRDDFEVSIPELDALVEFAGEAGAMASRMTGGGFGGRMLALVAEQRADDVADEVCRRYADRFPDTPATPHRCRAGDGAHEAG